jgi:hypothetical protein
MFADLSLSHSGLHLLRFFNKHQRRRQLQLMKRFEPLSPLFCLAHCHFTFKIIVMRRGFLKLNENENTFFRLCEKFTLE